MKLPAELRPSDVRVTIDTREQCPADVAPMPIVFGTLPTGDYALTDAPNLAAIERKSEGDLLACVGVERERFDREIRRLLAYPCRAIVVESTWHRMETGDWRSKVTPAAAMGSLLGWVAMGVPVLMAGDHERAGRFIARILFTAARRRWRELRAMHKAIAEVTA